MRYDNETQNRFSLEFRLRQEIHLLEQALIDAEIKYNSMKARMDLMQIELDKEHKEGD